MILSAERKAKIIAQFAEIQSVDGCDWIRAAWEFDPHRPFEGEAEALATQRAKLEKAGAQHPAWKRGRK